MASFWKDLIKDSEKIKKSLMDEGCRVFKYVERAKSSPAKAAKNLTEAARHAEKWERTAKSKNVTVHAKHFERMRNIAHELRAASKNVPPATERALKAVKELRAVVENTKLK